MVVGDEHLLLHPVEKCLERIKEQSTAIQDPKHEFHRFQSTFKFCSYGFHFSRAGRKLETVVLKATVNSLYPLRSKKKITRAFQKIKEDFALGTHSADYHIVKLRIMTLSKAEHRLAGARIIDHASLARAGFWIPKVNS